MAGSWQRQNLPPQGLALTPAFLQKQSGNVSNEPRERLGHSLAADCLSNRCWDLGGGGGKAGEEVEDSPSESLWADSSAEEGPVKTPAAGWTRVWCLLRNSSPKGNRIPSKTNMFPSEGESFNHTVTVPAGWQMLPPQPACEVGFPTPVTDRWHWGSAAWVRLLQAT